jgi:hypothetical protein
MRLTLAAFKDTVNWPQVLNMDSSDARWLQLLNQASHRLLSMGMWMGTTQRYAICVTNGCLTWPRQFETIIAMDVCNRPITLRSQWHEFLENGPGLSRLGGCSSWNAFDRGSGFVMFDDVTVASKIRLYPQFAGDVGKVITIRGLDENYQPVLTDSGAVVGEEMTLASPFVDSVTTWGKQVFREVIKEVTLGHVTAYSYDASLPVPPASPGPLDTPLTPLAVWEPGETLPDYRRSFIPSLSNCCNCDDDEDDDDSNCCRTPITVIAKMRFIPITSDLDFLPIGNPSALKLAMLSVMREERGDSEGARAAMYGMLDPLRRRYIGGAIPILEDELDSWQGAGMVAPLRLESSMTGRPTVLNLI